MKIERVLILEDEAKTRQWLRQCVGLAFPGAVVVPAASLKEGRKIWRNGLVHARAHGRTGAFDVALVDIGLPDGSGIDLIGEIAREDGHCVPIVTTIYDDPRQIFDAISAGARGYLLKYHETEKLIQLLRRILDDEPPLSPAVARQVVEALKASNVRAVPAEAALTGREVEVLSLLGRGFPLRSVAEALSISQNTASTHVKSIYRKLNIKSRAEAALAARDRGLLSRD